MARNIMTKIDKNHKHLILLSGLAVMCSSFTLPSISAEEGQPGQYSQQHHSQQRHSEQTFPRQVIYPWQTFPRQQSLTQNSKPSSRSYIYFRPQNRVEQKQTEIEQILEQVKQIKQQVQRQRDQAQQIKENDTVIHRISPNEDEYLINGKRFTIKYKNDTYFIKGDNCSVAQSVYFGNHSTINGIHITSNKDKDLYINGQLVILYPKTPTPLSTTQIQEQNSYETEVKKSFILNLTSNPLHQKAYNLALSLITEGKKMTATEQIQQLLEAIQENCKTSSQESKELAESIVTYLEKFPL